MRECLVSAANCKLGADFFIYHSLDRLITYKFDTIFLSMLRAMLARGHSFCYSSYMTLNWYGEGCFRLESRGITVAIDPFESGLGLTAPRFASSIILVTAGPIIKPYVSQKLSDVHTVSGPGEYEIQGMMIHGVAVGATIAYTLRTEDITIAFFGGLASPTDISADALEALSTADIVCLPVGGAPHLDAAAAVTLIKKLGPKIVIPSFYAIPGLKRKCDGVGVFEKAIGQHPEPQEKLSIKAKELIWEGTKLTVLKS